MYLELDAVRLHRDIEHESKDPPAEKVVNESHADDFEVQDLGDPRLRDICHFEPCAHETFSEEFCVPSKGNAKTKSLKRHKTEGEIKWKDLEDLCETILTQEERRGYWEIRPDDWTDESLAVFVYESIALYVQRAGESRELVK